MADPAPPPRPILKLTVSRQTSFAESPVQTPKIKIRTSLPSTPAEPFAPPPTTPASKTKTGRQTKPSAKKRHLDEFGEDDTSVANGKAQPPAKKITIKKTKDATSRAARITVKHKGKPPLRIPGDGYDSEAEDRETDPVIEEQIIMRMMPGEHCDYMRKAIEENKLGNPKDKEPGADIRLKFLDDDSRRAILFVNRQPFAAVLVDLPTITESMKTWDRKAFMKSADISQMLLIFKTVASEDEARTTPLPAAVESGFKWPHGLTPPMHDCVNRRFAKIISRKEIEDKEKEVERLLAVDRAAVSSKWEWADERQPKTPGEDGEEEEEEDADGEEEYEGYFPPQGDYDNAADLEAELEAAFEEVGRGSTTSPATHLEGDTPMTGNTTTPAANIQESVEVEESEEDEDDDDMDEEEQARLDELKGVKDIIADMEQQLRLKEQDLQKPNVAASVILRKRVQETIRTLRAEIQLKKSSIGEEEE